MNIEVYSDGSATSNKPGGWGYVIVIDGIKHSEGSGHMENASNNDAELEAAYQGLKMAHSIICVPLISAISKEFKLEEDPIVTLVSDSELVLGWVTGKYTFRQQEKMEKFKSLQLLVNLTRAKTKWVKGHSGNEHNERCDRLANEARTGVTEKVDKAHAILNDETLIGTKKNGTVCLWYKDILKVIDLDRGIVEDYNREIHGTRGSMLEIREEKSR